MKRSEMVYKLIGHVRDVTNQTVKLCEDGADLLLTFIEQSGMKPPTLPDDKRQAIMSVYYGGYTFNQWDEDFLKDQKVVEAYNRRKLK